MSARDPAAVVVRLRRISRASLRYARWFVDAGWSVSWAAHLFDLDAAELAAALDLPAAAA